MGRKTKAASITFETLVLERAPNDGSDLVAFVEKEIIDADVRCRATFFKSATQQDHAREQRLRLGRLLFWLRHGNAPLGVTESDKAIYRLLAEKSPSRQREAEQKQPTG